jgi:hypothetical protein
MHAAKPLVPKHSSFEVRIAIEKLKRYNSPDTNQIPVELIMHEAVHYILRSTNLLIVFGIKKMTATAVGGIFYCTYL